MTDLLRLIGATADVARLFFLKIRAFTSPFCCAAQPVSAHLEVRDWVQF